MMEAIETLRMKGSIITEKEAEATLAAILLHDIGHGPYSHSLEHSIVTGMSHEVLSSFLMQRLNKEFEGRLELAISIFSNNYHKKFLHQLVSSQLDMDRLDYLKRDSFYTGVSEGVINTDRLIKMLIVKDDELMVEAKGIYSIEKFIVARRLMYWQVYYHKTVVGAENMMINILNRAKYLVSKGDDLFASPALKFFLKNSFTEADFIENQELIEQFALLDDYDIFSSIKVWVNHPDTIISFLANGLVNRKLMRTELSNTPFTAEEIDLLKQKISMKLMINDENDTMFLFSQGEITNNAYIPEHDKINILNKDGSVIDVTDSSDQLNVSILTKSVTKHFLSYPKEINRYKE